MAKSTINPLAALSVAQQILLTGRQETATEWSPLSLPSLVLWLDATSITVVTDGDPLAVWSDRSGHGNDATQPTFAQRPTYRLVGGVGGKPVVRFDGADDGFTLAARIAPAQLYVAAVVRSTSADADAVLLATYEGAEGGWAFGVRATSGGLGGSTLKCYTQGSDPAYPGAFPFDTFALAEVRHDGVTKTLLVDGALLRADVCALPYGANPAYRTALGCGDYLGSGFQRFGGDMAEIVVCDAVPDASAQAALRSYLAAKWGIALASNGGN